MFFWLMRLTPRSDLWSGKYGNLEKEREKYEYVDISPVICGFCRWSEHYSSHCEETTGRHTWKLIPSGVCVCSWQCYLSQLFVCPSHALAHARTHQKTGECDRVPVIFLHRGGDETTLCAECVCVFVQQVIWVPPSFTGSRRSLFTNATILFLFSGWSSLNPRALSPRPARLDNWFWRNTLASRPYFYVAQ